MTQEDKRASKRIGRKFIMRVGADLKSRVPVWSLVSTHNFSASGALFTMDQEVKIGEQVWIKVHFLERVIDCRGRVVRFGPGFQKPLVLVGIVFESLEIGDKEFIEHFCSQFKE